jgi:Flp pilus assembly protein TadG
MRRNRQRQVTGFLGRFRKNVAGNVLILTAAAMIPLCAMVGGALDLSRLYLTKVRLQHACDAGALAGRKEMGGGSWDATAQQAATDYFAGNFRQGSYGSGTTTAKFSSSGSDVSGTVTTSVPMTIMTMFGFAPKVLTVSCLTAMQLPNTDVMFVLDTTGSMACLPTEGSCGGNVRTGSKITVLKNAVKCFYEALAQQKTNATNCAANAYQNLNKDAQLRFGFVPYSSNVNISQLKLPASYFAKKWDYQSRSKTTDWSPWANTSFSCGSRPADTPTHQYRSVQSGWTSCYVQDRTFDMPSWLYAKTNLLIDPSSALNAFASYSIPNTPAASSITIPGIGANFTARKVSWDGCIEEKTATTNINAIPNAADVTTQYGPVLPDAIYLRNAPAGNLNIGSFSLAQSVTTADYYNDMDNYRYFCPAPAEKLTGTDVWTPTNFGSYVDSIKPVGNTYHDYGMLWGGRLLSPEGMFASENAATPTGGVIQRHLIFMTDGDAQANSCDYTNYGVAWWDRRTNNSPGSCSNSEDSNLTNDVNSRLASLCAAIKNEPNTIIWVISFGGTGITLDTKNRLRTCATDDDHFFDATSAPALKSAFENIAGRIAQLRLEK